MAVKVNGTTIACIIQDHRKPNCAYKVSLSIVSLEIQNNVKNGANTIMQATLKNLRLIVEG